MINIKRRIGSYALVTLLACLSQAGYTEETTENSLSKSLDALGIQPILMLSVLHLENPSLGQKTGQKENVYQLHYGVHLDLEKLAGIDNTQFTLQQLYVPNITNYNYGYNVADSVNGDPAPYIPKKSHLMKLTIKHQFFDNRLDVEIGKSGAFEHFATPLCNLIYGCQSPLIPFHPNVYVSWGARARLNINHDWSTQLGSWSIIDAYPFTNGWEMDEKASAYMTYGNVVYHRHDQYLEILLYDTNDEQTDPLTQDTHQGTQGYYVGYRNQLYAGGKLWGMPIPKIDLVEQFAHTFDQDNEKGLSFTNEIGLNFSSFIPSRPCDSYGIMLKSYHLTDHMQSYLKSSYASNGVDYTANSTETVLQLDTNIKLTDSIFVSGYIQRSWNTNSKNNVSDTTDLPQDGYGFGLMGIVLINQLLGL